MVVVVSLQFKAGHTPQLGITTGDDEAAQAAFIESELPFAEQNLPYFGPRLTSGYGLIAILQHGPERLQSHYHLFTFKGLLGTGKMIYPFFSVNGRGGEGREIAAKLLSLNIEPTL